MVGTDHTSIMNVRYDPRSPLEVNVSVYRHGCDPPAAFLR